MSAVVTDEMVRRGADQLTGIAHMGCTCPWDEDGSPPADCQCAERWDRDRMELARSVIAAALTDPRTCGGCGASLADMRADAKWCGRACKIRTDRRVAAEKAEQTTRPVVRRPGGLQVAFGPAVNAWTAYLASATPLSAKEARKVAVRITTKALSAKQRQRARRARVREFREAA